MDSTSLLACSASRRNRAISAAAASRLAWTRSSTRRRTQRWISRTAASLRRKARRATYARHCRCTTVHADSSAADIWRGQGGVGRLERQRFLEEHWGSNGTRTQGLLCTASFGSHAQMFALCGSQRVPRRAPAYQFPALVAPCRRTLTATQGPEQRALRCSWSLAMQA
jgi:hypothetical protein